MGDLRNKLEKQRRQAAYDAKKKKLRPWPDPMFLCLCGASPTWVEPIAGNRTRLYCEACRVKAGLKL